MKLSKEKKDRDSLSSPSTNIKNCDQLKSSNSTMRISQLSLKELTQFISESLAKSLSYARFKKEAGLFLNEFNLLFSSNDVFFNNTNSESQYLHSFTGHKTIVDEDGSGLKVIFGHSPTDHSLLTQYAFSRARENSKLTELECELCEMLAVYLSSLRLRKDETKEFERQIRYFKSILDIIPHRIVCISLYNAEIKFSYVNSQAEEGLKSKGMSLNDIHVYDSVQKLIHPEDQEAVYAAIRRSLSDGTDITDRRRFWMAGKFKWSCFRLRCIKNALGKTDHLVCTFTDVEQEMELERKIAYNTAKAKFLAVMSHEIKTPIGCISGIANLLQETTLNLEQQEYVKTIRMCSEELSSLVDNILEYAKLDQGKVKLQLQEVDMLLFAENIIKLFAGAIQTKNISVFYSFQRGFYRYVVMDEFRLKQVLINLLSNAIKFSPENSDIFLEFGIDKIEKGEEGFGENCENVEIWIKVRDNGIGMTKEFVENDLFKSFCQADFTTCRKYGGSGLGLAICKSLMDLMDGGIDCSSELKKGTTFTIRFSVNIAVGRFGVKNIFPFAYYSPRISSSISFNCSTPEKATNGVRLFHVLIIDNQENWLQFVTNICHELIEKVLELSNINLHCIHEVPTENDADNTRNIVLICDVKDFQECFTSLYRKCIIFSEDKLKKSSERKSYISKPILITEFFQILTDKNEKITDESNAGTTEQSKAPVSTADLSIFNESMANLSSFTSATSLQHSHENLSSSFLAIKRFEKARILIAEDNPINQKILLKMLHRLHISQVDVTSNGLEAFLKFSEKMLKFKDAAYHLILMDISMPEMDGFSCSEKIYGFCQSNQCKRPVIIAISAHSDLVEQYANAKGIADFIRKPIRLEKLQQTLQSYLIEIEV